MKIDIYYHLHGKKDKIVLEEVKEELRPVVRGRWVDDPELNRMCTCSFCGQWITKELSDCFNYCPTCGADMNVKPSETLVGYIPFAEETEGEG